MGKRGGNKPGLWLKDMDYYSQSRGPIIFLENDKDNLGEIHISSLYYNSYSCDTWYRTYRLNGLYSRFTGAFYWRYAFRNRDNICNSLKVYADKELVFNAEINNNSAPVLFNIPLAGVLELKIEAETDVCSAIGDCGFWQ